MVGPHDLVRNEQPQPQPLVAAGLALTAPERVKQMWQQLRGEWCRRWTP